MALEPAVTFGGLLRQLRLEAGMTQEGLAEASGVRARTLSDLERGVAVRPQRDTVRRLAGALNLFGPDWTRFEVAARGRAETDPGAAGWVVAARTLPRDISSFTGRHPELQQLLDTAVLRGRSNVLVVEGMAGVGKTALAVHAAHMIADRFPDGHIFLPLYGHSPGRRPVAPGDAIASLLLTIGVPAAQIPPRLEARAALWRDRLADRRVLLVLDDAVGSDQVRPLLPGAASSLVLVTSRRHLSALDDATAVSLDALPAGDAAALLARLAGRPGLSAEDAAAGELAGLCGYLPLAIAMVARRLHHHPAWTPTALAAELAAAQDRLQLMAAGDVSIGAALDLSYADLTAQQQRLFRRLGLHPGIDVDAYAAAALDGTDLAAAHRGLEDLHDQYLLAEPVQGRYRLHDLIREHARVLAERLDPPDDRDEATARLLDYYAHTVQAADSRMFRRPLPEERATAVSPPQDAPDFPKRQDAVTWTDAERVNLHAAAYAAARDRPDRAIAIAEAMHRFLLRQGYWDEALELSLLARSAARDNGDLLAEAAAVADMGEIQQMRADFPAASETLQQALNSYRELGHLPGEALVLHSLAVVEYATGQYAVAIGSFTRVLDLHRELGDSLGEARALAYLGAVQGATGSREQAVRTLDQALGLYRALGDPLGEASALLRLGAVQHQSGEHAEAVRSLMRALDLYLEIGDALGQASALYFLGTVQRETGDYRMAIESLTRALAIYRDLGARYDEAGALAYLGAAQGASGDYDAADRNLRRALDVYRQLGSASGQAEALNLLGAVQRESGRAGEAGALHEQALRLARQIASSLEEARALEGIGRISLREGRHEQAAELLRQSQLLYAATSARDAGRVRELVEQTAARSVDTPVSLPERPGPPGPGGGMPPGNGGGNLGPGHPRRRYLLGQCPDSVAPGEVFSLIVSVVTGGGSLLKSFDVPAGGLPLLLVVHAPGIRVFSSRRQMVVVPAAGDSEPVMFELLAGDPGQRRITVTAWEKGSYLGELIVEVGVQRDAPPRQDQTVRGEIRDGHVDGEVTLVVRHDQDRNYRFEFRDIDNPSEVQATLAYDPGPAVERLLARLDRLAEGRGGYPPGVARDYLVNAGLELWEQLIPEALRRQFWERQPRIKQLTILSDADTVPWELLYPKDPGREAGFLVEQFPVTRAVFGRWPSRSLRLSPARFVLPEGSPSEAATEVEALRTLLEAGPQGADVVSAVTPLLDLIRAGEFGLLHFACHNRFDPADGSTINLDCPFLPMQLNKVGSDRTLAGHTPLVFINACRSAGQLPSYNRLDGWADKFLRAGAAAFIGSLWAVRDTAAREFAEELYGKLQAGETLGQAVMAARRAAAADPGDPTWLAYAVYGDPMAKTGTIEARPAP